MTVSGNDFCHTIRRSETAPSGGGNGNQFGKK